MGFNTAAIVLNDSLNSIAEDPEIGERIRQAVNSSWRDEGDITARGHGIHIGAIRVLPPQHADYVQIVAIGRNTIRRLGTSGKWEPEDLLRDLADQLGYSLRKKASKAA